MFLINIIVTASRRDASSVKRVSLFLTHPKDATYRAKLLNEVVEGQATPDTTRVEAGDYGHHGYVSAADNSKRTIWLFFYDNQEECDMILNHIKEDIVVQQYEQKRG